MDKSDSDERQLYGLIWRRFVACQMQPAKFLSTSLVAEATSGDDTFELRTNGRVMQFDGYLKVAVSGSKADRVLPGLAEGQRLGLVELLPTQQFTKPPARYNEASLVKELEARGIGRPSTYATVVTTIQERGYVEKHGRQFFAEKIGDVVTQRLEHSFTDLMDYGFTAGMEQDLDDIAAGNREWTAMLDAFFETLSTKIETAGRSEEEGGMKMGKPHMTSIKCPSCQRPMALRLAATGMFLGCSGYGSPDPCRTTMSLTPVDVLKNDIDTIPIDIRRCGTCSSMMDSYIVDQQRCLHVCADYPRCDVCSVEEGNFDVPGYSGSSVPCDKCTDGQLQLKTGRFGPYYGCNSCGNTRKVLKDGTPAPPKMDPVPFPELRCEKVDDTYVLRDGMNGLFLAASQFPKKREIRAPFVDELLPHKDEIDPKYSHLFSAPVTDPDGNRAVVKCDRTTKEHYIMGLVDGKSSGYSAHYDSTTGQWNWDAAVKKVAKPRAKKAPAKRSAKPRAKKAPAKRSTRKKADAAV
uniref:Topo IA-type catalytic domain-containing protein n=1 Tax=Eutreptiella gymnastica TaxID=73025 RepID=A0A7S1NKF3_9EUGL